MSKIPDDVLDALETIQVDIGDIGFQTDSYTTIRAYIDRLTEENAKLLRLLAPGLRVYSGDYVVQIDAGKLGLFTERFINEKDKARALRAVQQAAINAVCTGDEHE